MENRAVIITDASLTYIDSDHHLVIHSSNARWNEILEAAKRQDWDEVIKLGSIKEQVAKYLYGQAIKLEGHTLYYQDTPVHNSLTDRIIRMMNEGFEVKPMLQFLDNLMQNPSHNSINQLYTFLEVNELPITEDGCFMAYKRVNDNYTDVYTGMTDNTPGRGPIRMKRNEVDDDPTMTCSSGYHVASLEYLKHYWGPRLIACKIKPQNVVSVPKDYNGSKMRVCEYEPIQELDINLVVNDDQDVLSMRAVYEEGKDSDSYIVTRTGTDLEDSYLDEFGDWVRHRKDACAFNSWEAAMRNARTMIEADPEPGVVIDVEEL